MFLLAYYIDNFINYLFILTCVPNNKYLGIDDSNDIIVVYT